MIIANIKSKSTFEVYGPALKITQPMTDEWFLKFTIAAIIKHFRSTIPQKSTIKKQTGMRNKIQIRSKVITHLLHFVVI